jgi:hypothetical protein
MSFLESFNALKKNKTIGKEYLQEVQQLMKKMKKS